MYLLKTSDGEMKIDKAKIASSSPYAKSIQFQRL